MADSTITDELVILEISDVPVTELTIHKVRSAFNRLALAKHPDKAGGSTSAFQELLSAYNKVLRYLSENLHQGDLDNDEQFLKDMFNKFNFPHENHQSFTILI